MNLNVTDGRYHEHSQHGEDDVACQLQTGTVILADWEK